MKDIKELMDATVAVCEMGEGVGGNGFRLAASIIDGSHILAAAVNTTKTHPLMLKFGKYPHLHAEVHACIKAGLQNCIGKDILIVRLKKDGSYGLAKPCPSCEKFLKHVGIRTVCYTTNSKDLEWYESNR